MDRVWTLLRRGWVRWNELSPQALFVASFALLIGVGTAGLLWLPGLSGGPRIGFIDSLFTITSAVCVTGLSVVDLATTFTFWGQLWVLLFIQAGGLGVFSLSTLIIGGMGRRLTLRSEILSTTVPEGTGGLAAVRLTFQVAKFTFLFEGVGALLLALSWVPQFGWRDGLWHAVFHSVSAFCNAGFSTFSDNLESMGSRPFVLLTVSALVVAGGLGYLALEETTRWLRAADRSARRRLSSHTTAVLAVSGLLLAAGAVLFGLLEWDGALARFHPVDKVVNAWFMSVTPRTAGFNSVPYLELRSTSAFITILLMAIGGSPGSTAGGIKTTSAAVLVALAAARVRGRLHVVLHGRSIPQATVERTVSLALIAFVVVGVSVLALSTLEDRAGTSVTGHEAFLPHLFEVTSALGTVGLSMNLTPTLGSVSRLLLVALMYMGRVGPLTFFAAVSLRGHPEREVRPAHEDIIVG